MIHVQMAKQCLLHAQNVASPQHAAATCQFLLRACNIPEPSEAAYSKSAVALCDFCMQIAVRVRPVLPHEASQPVAVTCSTDGSSVQIMLPEREFSKPALAASSKPDAKSYEFDACLPGSTTQVGCRCRLNLPSHTKCLAACTVCCSSCNAVQTLTVTYSAVAETGSRCVSSCCTHPQSLALHARGCSTLAHRSAQWDRPLSSIAEQQQCSLCCSSSKRCPGFMHHLPAG
jgi:hypothetical protein